MPPTRPERLPRRLLDLRAHLQEREDLFADWQLERRAPLTPLWPKHDGPLVEAASRDLVPIAGDFSGGVLVLDMSGGDEEHAPVVDFDSEGGITVRGESFDDFLALIASNNHDDEGEKFWAEPPLKRWLKANGVAPHPSGKARLAQLAESTRLFRIRWFAAMREAARQLRPNAPVEFELILGKRIGDAAVGDQLADLERLWGKPQISEYKSFGLRPTAIFPRSPCVVTLDDTCSHIVAVRLFSGLHIARMSEISPMFMRASDLRAALSELGVHTEHRKDAVVTGDGKTTFDLESVATEPVAEPWVRSVAVGDSSLLL